MSNRLAISASFSILMMAIYVLFGKNVQRVPLGPAQFTLQTRQTVKEEMPGLPNSPGEVLQLFK